MKNLLFVLIAFTVVTIACKKNDNSSNNSNNQTPAPVASFSYNLLSSAGGVIFTNNSTNANSYSWNFGDGQSSSETSPQHIYASNGNYTVSLTASGAGGSHQTSQSITVNTYVIPTNLKLIVKNSLGNPVSSASVKLYSSSTDWNNGTNQVGYTQYTNSLGEVTFTNLSAIKYYWLIESGCQNNVNGAVTTTTPITANTTTSVNIILSSTGTLAFNNTSTNPYRVYINGTAMFEMNGGTSKYLYYEPTGSYTIRVLQLSGYVLYPTDETFNGTLNCGSTLTTTFP